MSPEIYPSWNNTHSAPPYLAHWIGSHLKLLTLFLTPNISGTTQVPKPGTDVLLDLLSIGTPTPAQSSISASDILSSIQDNKMPANTLERLSSTSSISVQPPSTPANASMMDLLDGFGSSQPLPGTRLISISNSVRLQIFSQDNHNYLLLKQKTMVLFIHLLLHMRAAPWG